MEKLFEWMFWEVSTPSLSSEGVLEEEDFTSANIKSVKVMFRPGRRILAVLSSVSFKKKL